jgi:hypothetical protein
VIINISRANGFQECRQRNYYYDHDRIVPFTVADPLLLGSAYHDGLAQFFASGDIVSAVIHAEAKYRDGYAAQEKFILPEERPLIERHVTWLTNSLAEFVKHYAKGDIQVIQPEVEFCVPLEGTEHHSNHFHKILYGAPLAASRPGYTGPSCDDPRCIQPHWFRGKTDAVVEWQGRMWLFEHKTEARTGDGYFTKFLLDFQPTGYLFGIRQSTGLRPAGFVLNIIKKPNAAFKGDPLSVVGFEREVYLRSDQDLDRFATQLGSLADDYERAAFDPTKIYMNTKACMNWNRKCDYHDICLNHGDYDASRYQTRPVWDYVEKAYYDILGLPVPPEPGSLVNITV